MQKFVTDRGNVEASQVEIKDCPIRNIYKNCIPSSIIQHHHSRRSARLQQADGNITLDAGVKINFNLEVELDLDLQAAVLVLLGRGTVADARLAHQSGRVLAHLAVLHLAVLLLRLRLHLVLLLVLVLVLLLRGEVGLDSCAGRVRGIQYAVGEMRLLTRPLCRLGLEWISCEAADDGWGCVRMVNLRISKQRRTTAALI